MVLIAGAGALLLADPIREFNYRNDYVPPTPLPTLTHWTEAEGTPVSRGILEVYRGPEHCNWESSLMLFTGDPIGTVSLRDQRERQYLRDPAGVYPQQLLMTTYDGDVQLPSTAGPTGYEWEGAELWLDTAGPEDSIYMVYDDHVERWPRATEVIRCR